MSRTVTNTGTFTGYPSSYISKTVDGSWYSLNNYSNAYKGYDQNTSAYCQIGLARGASAYTYIYFKFDTSSIPANATINSISCIARVFISNQSASNIASKGAVMCSGATEKTNAVSVTTTPSNRTFTMGTWTRAELDDVRLKIYATRNTSNVNSSYYLRCYGATLTISYTYEETYYTVTASCNISGGSVSPTSAEYLQGSDVPITISVSPHYPSVEDNGVDVSSQIVVSGSDYIYTIYGIAADHTIIISQGVQPSGQTIFYKQNGSWVAVDKIFCKQNGSWVEVKTLSVKQSGSWVN